MPDTLKCLAHVPEQLMGLGEASNGKPPKNRGRGSKEKVEFNVGGGEKREGKVEGSRRVGVDWKRKRKQRVWLRGTVEEAQGAGPEPTAEAAGRTAARLSLGNEHVILVRPAGRG